MNPVKPDNVTEAPNVFDLTEDHNIIEEEIVTSYSNESNDSYIFLPQASMATNSFVSPYDEMDTDDILYSIGNNQSTTNDHQFQGINNSVDIYGTDNSISMSAYYDSDNANTPPSAMDMESEEYTLELENQLGVVNNLENTDNTINTYGNVTYVDLLSSDDEDKGGKKTETSQLMQPKPVPVDINTIVFLPGSKDNIFPRYDRNVISTLKQFLNNKTEKDKVHLNTRGPPFLIGDLMRLLTPTAWLNDIIVQNYISLTMRYCKPNVLDLNSHFIYNLKLRGHKSASRWIKKGNVFCYKKIIIPINPGRNHWALIEVKIKTGQIHIYNSFNIIPKVEVDLLVDFFCSEYKVAFKDQETDITYPKYWVVETGKSPQQNNDYDCGVFTCTNVRYTLLGREIDYSQEDIPFLRQRIAFELINDTLLPF